MAVVFEKTGMLCDVPFHFCPGCTHGIAHRLVAECIEELGYGGRSVGIAPVGCAVFAYNYFACDMVQAAHGRAPAVATGVKRVHPNNLVFTYQGDGDLASIGLAEAVHAAARGENISIIFINNAIYGMTGGQMAPTTLVGQESTTTPGGRRRDRGGEPLRVAEMLAQVDGAAFVERASLHDVPHIIKAKKAIKKAFECQLAGRGFSMVELLSTCPTNWGLTPVESMEWLKGSMLPYYQLGVKKEVPANDV